MKKILLYLLTFLLCGILNQSVFAQNEAVKHIYSTDILAFVNKKPINGYNIGGKTVVIAEDLDGYGFDVIYNDETRTLKVNSYFNYGYKQVEEIQRGKIGEILGNIYKTDIKVYYNGLLIEGYNIGGRTAICLEDLSDTTDSEHADFGYSKYLGKAVWDAKNRTISYESYIKNEEEILGISRVYHRFKDNVIYTYSDDFYAKSEFLGVEDGEIVGTYTYSQGTGASKYRLKPLYFDNHGELIKIGLCVANPNNSADEALMYIENPQMVKDMIKTYKTPQKSHDEAISYFSEECRVIEKIENNNYTVLLAEHENKGMLFIYINKNGGFVADSFFADYKNHEIKFWFDEKSVNNSPDTVIHSVYPFAGTHGTTTMQYATDLNEFDYE